MCVISPTGNKICWGCRRQASESGGKCMTPTVSHKDREVARLREWTACRPGEKKEKEKNLTGKVTPTRLLTDWARGLTHFRIVGRTTCGDRRRQRHTREHAVNTDKLTPYLAAATSWRLLPCPPGAVGSWGLGPAQRRRRPVRRHGDQGTEGQHPVGSMPAKGREVTVRVIPAPVSRHSMGLYTNTLADTLISRHLHFFHMSSFRNVAPLSPLYSHNRVITGFFCTC